MKKKSNSKPDRKDVFVKSRVHHFTTDLKDQEEDVKKILKDADQRFHWID